MRHKPRSPLLSGTAGRRRRRCRTAPLRRGEGAGPSERGPREEEEEKEEEGAKEEDEEEGGSLRPARPHSEQPRAHRPGRRHKPDGLRGSRDWRHAERHHVTTHSPLPPARAQQGGSAAPAGPARMRPPLPAFGGAGAVGWGRRAHGRQRCPRRTGRRHLPPCFPPSAPPAGEHVPCPALLGRGLRGGTRGGGRWESEMSGEESSPAWAPLLL